MTPGPAQAQGTRPWKTAALLTAATLLALALRGWRITAEAAWCDEVLTLSVLDAPSLAAYLRDAFTVDPMTRMVPVYHLVQYGWSCLFGPSELAARWLSITLGVACVPLLFVVTRRLVDEKAALLAVFLLALSQVHLYQSQEVRFYALMLALALTSSAALLRALDTKQRGWWMLHGAANALLLWTHAFAPLFFAAQGAGLLLLARDRRLAWWCAFHAGLGAAFLAWLWGLGFAVGRESHAYHLMRITWRDLANTFVVFAGGRPTRENPAPYMPDGVSLDLMVAVLLAAALGAVGVSLVHRRDPARTGQAVLLLWAVVPFLILYVVSRTWANVFFYRYVIYALPPTCALFAAGLCRLPGAYLRRAAIALALVALAWQAVAMPRPIRADYRAAGLMMADGATDNTRVLALKEFNAVAVRYNTPLPEAQVETYHGLEDCLAAAKDHLREGRPVWAVFYWWDRIDDFEAGVREAVPGAALTRRVFPGMPPLTVCRLRPPP